MRWKGLPTCVSTQDEAQQSLTDDRDQTFVVIVSADEQTTGRGRAGRSWSSSADAGIYLSIGIPGPMSVTGAEQWPRRIAEAVVGALREHAGVVARVREPNDIYVGERKLGGILIDTASTRSDVFDRVIVGVGINVLGEHSDIGGRPATSIFAETGAGAASLSQQREPLSRAIAHAALGVLVNPR